MKKTTKQKKTKYRKKKLSRKKKGVARIFLFIFLAIIICIFLLLLNVNSLTKFAIGKFGSQAVGTAVHVDNVDIKLLKGSAGIYKLTVGNPPGFEKEHIFSLGEVSMAIDLKSMLDDVKVIDDIIVDALVIYVEINNDNSINLNTLRKNLPKIDKKSEDKGQSNQDDTMLRIQHLRFSNSQIYMTSKRLNKKYKLKLPSFEMFNLGEASGATSSQIIRQVLAEVSNRALGQVRKKGIEIGKERIGDIAKSMLEQKKRNIGDKVKGLLK